MKNDIKFRCFDGEQMHYPESNYAYHLRWLRTTGWALWWIWDDEEKPVWEEFGVNSQYPLMQYIGFKDTMNQELYQGDIVDFTPPEKNNGFWNSNCGTIMLKNGIESLRIVFNSSEYLSLDYTIYFMEDGTAVSKKYWFEKMGDSYADSNDEELKELLKMYDQSDDDVNFIKYLIDKKGISKIGNIHENPHLLP